MLDLFLLLSKSARLLHVLLLDALLLLVLLVMAHLGWQQLAENDVKLIIVQGQHFGHEEFESFERRTLTERVRSSLAKHVRTARSVNTYVLWLRSCVD